MSTGRRGWAPRIDLYGYDDSRFLKGAQYVARWSMGGEVPYTANTRRKGAVGGWSGSESATAAAGVDPTMTRPVWAMIANHYTRRRGLSATYLTRIAAQASPEGGGGDYGPNSGGYDQLGFGTLAFTRDKETASASPSPSPSSAGSSSGESASAGEAGVSPSAGATAHGGKGEDLAPTGTTDVVAWTATTGLTTLAGGLLLLCRRGRSGEPAQ